MMDFTKEFGCHVFNDSVMRQMLATEVFDSLQKTRREGSKLEESLAQPVADAMLKWALEQGATHYLHWFQPMTGSATGKSESFVSPVGDGTAIAEFSSHALVQGEPDASSFPSGGIRNTFEARGYTAWDPTSFVFVRDKTLYVPTAFCGPGGESLDQKTPLLRSMDALSQQAVRLLRVLGDTQTRRVVPQVGAEQEYFLIDRELYEKRLDLKLCGHTLLGALPPKTQQLDDHYYGRVRIRVSAFMHELDETLWKLGVAAITKHNEVAPTQHELACLYDSANVTCDTNQLVMETMRVVAKRHNLACLLHEKPFIGINGSGKHNNYSLSTDTGRNLLSPGSHPETNLEFLLFLAAFVRAVDLYAPLLRLSTATPNNDHRLGGYEAPPAIISMFLGDRLTSLLASCGHGDHGLERASFTTGVGSMPFILGDDADRNRTSPMAFTGNKFEFRMVGSSQSIAPANTFINAMLADSFSYFAERLEKSENVDQTVRELVCETSRLHGRVIMNGNNYAHEWFVEAERRGLPMLNNALDAIAVWTDPAVVELFGRFRILSPRECASRYEITMENYRKVILIEAATLLEMMKLQVIPAVIKAAGSAARYLTDLRDVGLDNASLYRHVEQLSDAITELTAATQKLEDDIYALPDDVPEVQNAFIRDCIREDMQAVRGITDAVERVVDKSIWPMPSYTDLLHRV
jgi:glutamine synthetase